MRHPALALLLSGVFLLVGCDAPSMTKYEIVRAGDQTFILNTRTGEARLVDGASLVPVTELQSGAGDAAVSQAKNWPAEAMPQLGKITITTRSKYRDGKMLYAIEAAPFSGFLEKELAASRRSALHDATLYIDLYDTDGFLVGEPIAVRVRDGTRIVNEKSEPTALSWTGSQVMSVETYQSASFLSVRWSGFTEEPVAQQ